MKAAFKKLLFILRRLSFSTRLFIYLFTFTFLLLAADVWFTSTKINEYLYTEVGVRAQVQAKQIAVIPKVIEAVSRKDIDALKTLGSRLKTMTDASYIVIGDSDGNHLYHSEYFDIRGPMVGGDNAAVLRGESIVSIRKGTLGYSLRGKAPIIDSNNTIIGIVSVGYLQTELRRITIRHMIPIIFWGTALFAVLGCFAWLFTRNIRKQILGLEPEDIRQIVRQQEAILESIFEGVIVIDTDYRIVLINRAAREMLGLRTSAPALTGKPISGIIEQTVFFHVDQADTEDKFDEVCMFNDLHVIASRVRVRLDDELQGWVVTFRDWNDISTLTMQLSQNRRYAENLRVLRHEHINWISTLAGLLYMKRYDEALRMIETQSVASQKLLDYVSATFRNPAIAGLLLGKFYRARELGLELEFDPGCRFSGLPASLGETELMSIIGNLIDNAFDAVRKGATSPKVTLFLSNSGDDVVIEVADEGCGIAPDLRDHIFERGVTSSGGADRGIGLYLVATYVNQAGGYITVDDNEPQGTIVSVFIPKTDRTSAAAGAETGRQSYADH